MATQISAVRLLGPRELRGKGTIHHSEIPGPRQGVGVVSEAGTKHPGAALPPQVKWAHLQKHPEGPLRLHALCLGNGRRAEGGGDGWTVRMRATSWLPPLLSSKGTAQHLGPSPPRPPCQSRLRTPFTTPPRADEVPQPLIQPTLVGHLPGNGFPSVVDAALRKPGVSLLF